MIELNIIRQKNYHELFEWTKCNHKSLYMREGGGAESEKQDVMSEAEVAVMQGRGRDLKNVGDFYTLEKAGKQILP